MAAFILAFLVWLFAKGKFGEYSALATGSKKE